MKQKIVVLGTGAVGKTLAAGLAKHGHTTAIGSRTRKGAQAAQAEIGNGLETGTFAEVMHGAEVAILAVKGTAALDVLRACGADNLAGMIVIDATNPIADAPPVNGVLQYFTGPNESLLERLQQAFPKARLVKAFSCVGSPFMVNPSFPGGRPTMFIAGNDGAAKEVVKQVLDEFGWESADMGNAEGARAIEPLAQLWCIPGLREGRWSHAFKLLTL